MAVIKVTPFTLEDKTVTPNIFNASGVEWADGVCEWRQSTDGVNWSVPIRGSLADCKAGFPNATHAEGDEYPSA